MIRKKAKSMNTMTESLCSFLQQETELGLIDISKEHVTLVVTPKNDMIERSGVVNTVFSCHRKVIRSKKAKTQA
jgi:hypothetical protein